MSEGFTTVLQLFYTIIHFIIYYDNISLLNDTYIYLILKIDDKICILYIMLYINNNVEIYTDFRC